MNPDDGRTTKALGQLVWVEIDALEGLTRPMFAPGLLAVLVVQRAGSVAIGCDVRPRMPTIRTYVSYGCILTAALLTKADRHRYQVPARRRLHHQPEACAIYRVTYGVLLRTAFSILQTCRLLRSPYGRHDPWLSCCGFKKSGTLYRQR
jgi:hypothetical protein